MPPPTAVALSRRVAARTSPPGATTADYTAARRVRTAPPPRAQPPLRQLPLLTSSSLLRRAGGRSDRRAIHAAAADGVQSPVQDLAAKTVEALLSHDPEYPNHEGHLKYRVESYLQTRENIIHAEGSLEKFAEGHHTFGFQRGEGCTVYREWAPGAGAAQLIGDFNGWNGTWMEKNEFGVWSVTLPDDPSGKPAIPHGSRVKIRLQHPDGWWADRLPAWIKWATVEPGKMGAKYDGIYWDPPTPYKWKNERPPRPQSLRIYETHVGMSSSDPKVASYTEFKDNVLPRIKALGYNAIQLMAVQEHAYYASFGYHVTNPFAVSSRSGTPEELKALIDAAHGMGIQVLLDVVHSHISSNVDDGLAGFDFGQGEDSNYFCSGAAGYHEQWDSRCLNYRNWEVLRYLLSNCRFWLEEYQFDGFRFDGVTSMLYHHHGINFSFTGNYHEYFSPATNVDAIVYLKLANELIHRLVPSAVTIAEDVSGMPSLCRTVQEGGIGFDYRLGMGIPDEWTDLLKNTRDEHWSMRHLVSTLCNRRFSEKTVAYCESHDQALVGDKTIAFLLMDAEMYDNMTSLREQTPVISRGVALHKTIRLLTMCIGGDAWLNFMGNEFGHPEWIDFPRDGNDWSYQHCRRQWQLVDRDDLLYHKLNQWDRDMLALDDKYGFMTDPHLCVSDENDEKQVIVLERGELVFVFNFSPDKDYEGLKVGVGLPGKYRVALDSDAFCYGGKGRVGHDVDHFTSPEGTPGVPETNFNNRPHSMMVLSPARTVVVYARYFEEEKPAVPEAASTE